MLRLLIFLPLALSACSSSIPAEELLVDYLEISDSGKTEQFSEVLSGSALSSALEANQIMSDLGLSQVGETRFYRFESTEANQYQFCLDVSETSLRDLAGQDRTPIQRPTQVPMLMKVQNFPNGPRISELDVRRFAKC